MEPGLRLEDVFADAVEAFQAFLPARKAVSQVRVMSLNAGLAATRLGAAGLPFQVVARQLAQIAPELEALISEGEQTFAVLVHDLATAVQRQDKVNRYRRAIATVVPDDAAAMEAVDLPILSRQARRAWRAAGARTDDFGTEAIWRAITHQRDEFVAALAHVDSAAQGLQTLLDRLESVGAKHTFAIAVNAGVEAARVGDPALSTVAHDIEVLAGAIRDAVARGAAEIEGLSVRAHDLVAPIRAELAGGVRS